MPCPSIDFCISPFVLSILEALLCFSSFSAISNSSFRMSCPILFCHSSSSSSIFLVPHVYYHFHLAFLLVYIISIFLTFLFRDYFTINHSQYNDSIFVFNSMWVCVAHILHHNNIIPLIMISFHISEEQRSWQYRSFKKCQTNSHNIELRLTNIY